MFAFEKKTLMRKLIAIVAIENEVSIQATTTGLLCVMTWPILNNTVSNSTEIVMKRRLSMNQAVQCTALPRPITYENERRCYQLNKLAITIIHSIA